MFPSIVLCVYIIEEWVVMVGLVRHYQATHAYVHMQAGITNHCLLQYTRMHSLLFGHTASIVLTVTCNVRFTLYTAQVFSNKSLVYYYVGIFLQNFLGDQKQSAISFKL